MRAGLPARARTVRMRCKRDILAPFVISVCSLAFRSFGNLALRLVGLTAVALGRSGTTMALADRYSGIYHTDDPRNASDINGLYAMIRVVSPNRITRPSRMSHV